MRSLPGDAPSAPVANVDVAAFDFDGTLTEGGSVFAFLVHLRGRSAVMAATSQMAPALARAALLGGEAADDTKQALFVRLLAGYPADEAATRAALFAEAHIGEHLRADSAERLRWHQRLGHRTVVVSASPEIYVREVARLLEIDGVVATRLAVDEAGLLTGRYEGNNCRGEEKSVRLRAWMTETRAAVDGGSASVEYVEQASSEPESASASPRRLWAYGNSRGDRELLDMADVGVNMGKLGRVGRLRRYPRLVELDQGVAAPPTV